DGAFEKAAAIGEPGGGGDVEGAVRDDAAEGRGRRVIIIAVQRGVVVGDLRERGDVLARDAALAELVGLARREVLEAVRLAAPTGIIGFPGGQATPLTGRGRGT